MCHSNPHQRIPSTTVTASHMTKGRVEYESMIPRDTGEGWIYGRLYGSLEDYKIHMDMEIVNTVHTSNKNTCLRSQELKSV